MSSSVRPAILGLVAVTAIIAACTAAMAFSAAQRGGTVGVLIDISPSNRGPLKGRIASCAKTAVAKAIDDGAVLLIAPVSSSPVRMAAPPVHSKLSLTERLTPRRAERIQQSARKRALEHVGEVLGGAVRRDSSDTIAATAIMGRALREQPGPRTMVICGDAHQVSPGFNIYREKLTPQRSQALIERVAADLGDLTTIDVIFGAAGLDTKAPFTNAREHAIARWWKAYWRPAVGARSLRYDSTLRFSN